MEPASPADTTETMLSSRSFNRSESPNHEVGSFTDGLLSEAVELDYHNSDTNSLKATPILSNNHSIRVSRSTIHSLPRQSSSIDCEITGFYDGNMADLDLNDSRDQPNTSTSSVNRNNIDMMKSCTLPACLGGRNSEAKPCECTIFNTDNVPKLSKWGTFKRRMYLGAVHNMYAKKTMDTPISNDDGEGVYEGVTDFEGLDLEGVPTMTQKSRKIFSWSRLKMGFNLKKRYPHDVAEIDQEASVETSEKTSKHLTNIKWFDSLTHRLFPQRQFDSKAGGHGTNKEAVAGGSSE